MRIRTIREAYKELHTNDPTCGLGLAGLYRLVSEGAIPSTTVGKRVLIDMDNLERYLKNGRG